MSAAVGLTRRQVGAGLLVLAGASPTGAEPVPRIVRATPTAWPLRTPPAAPTPVWTYDGLVAGPILTAKSGEDFAFELANDLPQATSFNIAGARLPNAVDGVPKLTGAAIAAGGRTSLRFPLRDRGFFTFGPADPWSAAEQSGRGLGGALIVADPRDPQVAADRVLLIQDWRLEGELQASFDDRAAMTGAGRLGTVLTVAGGGEASRIELAPGARFRLRLANLSNARMLPLKFDGLRPTLIGVSGQPSAPFTPLRGEMLLVPGGRYDLVCDVPLEARRPAVPRLDVVIGQPMPILAVDLLGPPAGVVRQPPVDWLSGNGLPAFIDLKGATRRDCAVTRAVDPRDTAALGAADPHRLWALEGRSGDLDGAPLFSVKRGTPVVLAIFNRTDTPIVIKLNGHVARLLHPRDDGWVPYWVDVVYVAPNAAERLAFVADNPGRWLIGGRILDHLAGGQFGWFEVA